MHLIPAMRIAEVRAIGHALILALAAAGAVTAQALELPVAEGRATTHADLVRALGDPPGAEVRPERLEPKPSPSGQVRSSGGSLFGSPVIVVGGELVLSYPGLGVVASIDREDRPLADPPLRWLSLKAPQAADTPRTPQGLFIGQPRQQAMEMASRHFRSRAAPPDSTDVTFVAEAGRRMSWVRPVYEMVLRFDHAQRLSEIHYEFKPGLTRPGKWALAGAMVLAVAALAAMLRWLWQHKLGAPTLPVASAGTAHLVGNILIAAGGLIGFGALGATGFAVYVALNSGGNAYGAMGAFFVGMYALVGLMGAAVLWFLGRQIRASA